MKNIIQEIEDQYPVDNIYVNNMQIWPILRMTYFSQYREKNSDIKSIQEKNLINKISYLKKIFYGWKSWFKKYNYIALTNSRQSGKKIINNKYYDKFLDYIIDKLGSNSVLSIEIPTPTHYKINEVHTQNIVSSYFINVIAYVYKLFFLNNVNIEGYETLQLIKLKYNLKINDYRIIKSFFSRVKIYKYIYKKMNIKYVFVVCYYSHIPAIKAAKEMKIQIIEIQHGIIGSNHPAYNFNLKLDQNYFPDYILTFGKQDIETFKISKFINYKKAHPIGNFYIDYLKNNFIADTKLFNKLSKWKKIVGVTLQLTVETKLIEFIESAAVLNGEVGFVLIPRQPVLKDYSGLDLPENVFILTEKDFYELMMYVDFHATVYSTCALEAPSLGVPNILVNINNLSKMYFENLLTNEKINKYVDSPLELVNIVLSFNTIDRKEISLLNEDIILTNYKDNVIKFIEKIQSEI